MCATRMPCGLVTYMCYGPLQKFRVTIRISHTVALSRAAIRYVTAGNANQDGRCHDLTPQRGLPRLHALAARRLLAA